MLPLAGNNPRAPCREDVGNGKVFTPLSGTTFVGRRGRGRSSNHLGPSAGLDRDFRSGWWHLNFSELSAGPVNLEFFCGGAFMRGRSRHDLEGAVLRPVAGTGM